MMKRAKREATAPEWGQCQSRALTEGANKTWGLDQGEARGRSISALALGEASGRVRLAIVAQACDLSPLSCGATWADVTSTVSQRAHVRFREMM